MIPLILLAKVMVYSVLGLSLAAALGVVLFRNLFHSALSLVGALVGVAVLYIALQAEFVAVVQILLYVGAVMTVVIFAIMLTHRLGDRSIPQSNSQSWPAFFALSGFTALLISLILKMDWSRAGFTGTVPPTRVSTLDLGKALLGEYVFPFEVISVVLIAALIGAVVVARKD